MRLIAIDAVVALVIIYGHLFPLRLIPVEVVVALDICRNILPVGLKRVDSLGAFEYVHTDFQ